MKPTQTPRQVYNKMQGVPAPKSAANTVPPRPATPTQYPGLAGALNRAKAALPPQVPPLALQLNRSQTQRRVGGDFSTIPTPSGANMSSESNRLPVKKKVKVEFDDIPKNFSQLS